MDAWWGGWWDSIELALLVYLAVRLWYEKDKRSEMAWKAAKALASAEKMIDQHDRMHSQHTTMTNQLEELQGALRSSIQRVGTLTAQVRRRDGVIRGLEERLGMPLLDPDAADAIDRAIDRLGREGAIPIIDPSSFGTVTGRMSSRSSLTPSPPKAPDKPADPKPTGYGPRKVHLD